MCRFVKVNSPRGTAKKLMVAFVIDDIASSICFASTGFDFGKKSLASKSSSGVGKQPDKSLRQADKALVLAAVLTSTLRLSRD